MEEKSPSVRPPAAVMSSRSSFRYGSGSPSRPGGGRCRATYRIPLRGWSNGEPTSIPDQVSGRGSAESGPKSSSASSSPGASSATSSVAASTAGPFGAAFPGAGGRGAGTTDTDDATGAAAGGRPHPRAEKPRDQ